jgi:predicted DNA-binding transcriptional regulator AlpA
LFVTRKDEVTTMTVTTDTRDGDLIQSLIQNLEAQPSDLPQLDRLVSVKTFCELTGWARSTVLRNEALGRIPRRRKLPNNQTAFLASEIIEWVRRLEYTALPDLHAREAAERFFR